MGIGLGEQERSKFWLKVLTELKYRGVKDLWLACPDGLTGFTEALKTAFPKTTHQLCVVPQIRNSLKYVAVKDQKAETFLGENLFFETRTIREFGRPSVLS